MSYHRQAENLLFRNKAGLTQFLNTLKASLRPESSLILHLSGLNLFSAVAPDGSVELETERKLQEEANQFDLIFGDLPLNIKKVNSELFPGSKVNKNWDLLHKALQKLKAGGLALFIMEPAILFSSKGKKVLQTLKEQGYEYCGAFNTPENILQPITSFRPILLAFTTEAGDQLFAGEISDDNHLLIENFLSGTDSSSFETGKLLAKGDFNSFSKHLTEAQIEKLMKQYSNYQLYKIADVSLGINKSKERFQNLPNCLYIARVGASPMVTDPDQIEIPGDYYQVQLDDSLVLADYMILFYRSALGRLILESLNSGSFIPRVTKSDFLNSSVAIPSMEDQNVLVQAGIKLKGLQETISQLQAELGLNPKNVSAILESYDSIQEPLKLLSSEDEVLGLIRKGEGKFIEFKQTFSRNIVTQKKDNGVEKATLKTIVGFLNAQGGTLLVGVSDKGEIIGVEDDVFNSNDSYLLHFRNTINNKIGPEFYPHIDYEIVKVLGKLILRVVCKPSRKPCFFDKKEFFVRTNPATDRLEGQQLLEYIDHHF